MVAINPIIDFSVEKKQLKFIGEDLSRPECILAKENGDLWCSDTRGGVIKIKKNGKQSFLSSPVSVNEISIHGDDLPNGLCFTENEEILIANFGKDCLEILNTNGERKILYNSIDGMPIGKVNFVLRDSKNRLWVTISTRCKNWMDAMHPNNKDGYIVLIEKNSVRIVADNLAFTNEIRLDDSEQFLYISETCGRHISRMKVHPNGSLTDKEIYGPTDLGAAGFPDGIVFDSYGNLWGTIIFGEKIFAITPKGDLKIIFDDGDSKIRNEIDKAYFAGTLTEELLLSGKSTVAPLMTSLTFGGKNLNQVYIGSVLGKSLPYFTAPVKGAKPL